MAGGSDGLGYAFAEAIARRGLNLVLVARQEARLEAAAQRLGQAYQVDVITVTANLADFEAAKRLLGQLDVSIGLLVYNAAFAPIGPFEHMGEDDLARAVAVNVKAPLLLAKWASQPMVERGRGGIVLMSSLAGSQGSPNLVAYSATKSFNATLAQGLWFELKPHGVDVVACCAGAISTPGYQEAENAKPAVGTMTPAAVAESTLVALGKTPMVIPGPVNKLARFALTRLLSLKTAITLMSKNTKGLS